MNEYLNQWSHRWVSMTRITSSCSRCHSVSLFVNTLFKFTICHAVATSHYSGRNTVALSSTVRYRTTILWWFPNSSGCFIIKTRTPVLEISGFDALHTFFVQLSVSGWAPHQFHSHLLESWTARILFTKLIEKYKCSYRAMTDGWWQE